MGCCHSDLIRLIGREFGRLYHITNASSPDKRLMLSLQEEGGPAEGG